MNKHDLGNMIYNLESRKNLKSVTLTQKANAEVLKYLKRLECLELELDKAKEDIENMKSFNENAMECHNDRVVEERHKKNDINKKAEIEHSMYSVWCRINQKEENEKTLKEYFKENNTDFWLKKRILEMFYGYVFEYNLDKEQWFFKKKKN